MTDTAKEYDVIVVGSGAAGGMAGFVLAKAGISTLMLEAGRNAGNGARMTSARLA